MSKDLSNYRKSYEKQELLESNCPKKPLDLFKQWFLTADESDSVEETNAMTISTIGVDGFPKSRVVLLKKYTEEGFIFYTNYNSEKGKAIAANNHICLFAKQTHLLALNNSILYVVSSQSQRLLAGTSRTPWAKETFGRGAPKIFRRG